jgi:hypothetical protein
MEEPVMGDCVEGLSMKKKIHHSYTLNNQILEQVPSNPYLGLQIAENLKWKEHINNTHFIKEDQVLFLSSGL